MAQYKDENYIDMINTLIEQFTNLLNTKQLIADESSTILGPMSCIIWDNNQYKGIESINNFFFNYYNLNIELNVISSSYSLNGERSFDCLLQCKTQDPSINFAINVYISSSNNKVKKTQNKANKLANKAELSIQEFNNIQQNHEFKNLTLEEQMSFLKIKEENVNKQIKIANDAKNRIETAKSKVIEGFWIRKIIFLKLI